MLHTYGKIGKMVIEQNGKQFNIDIRLANALCAFTHTRKATPEELEQDPSSKYYNTLWNFWADEQHIKKIMKSNNGDCFPAWDTKVKRIELNMYFKECKTILKYITRSGYKVTCYYKEVKEQ